jgi:hypothetical protein
VRARERQILGLDREVARSGFITFDNYLTKLRMMDHPLFLFGLKLHGMQGAVEFFDADFCNTLVIKSDLFEGITLSRVCEMLNQVLVGGGFQRDNLQVGKLKEVAEGFDLNSIVVRAEYKISLRFLDFDEAFKAYRALKAIHLESGPEGQDGKLSELEERHQERI